MATLRDALFLTVVAWVVVHELDAVRRQEWQFFFARVPVREETAYRIFTAAHVPLFLVVLWYLPSTAFQVGFDAFVVVHAGVHLVLRDRPDVDFEGWFSGLWIYGGAVLAALHLVVVL